MDWKWEYVTWSQHLEARGKISNDIRIAGLSLVIITFSQFSAHLIDVIYYYVIWTDNESRLLEADTRRQEGKYPMMKVLQGCVLKLLLYSVNTVLILYRTGNMQSAILFLYRTGNMQSAILLSFVTSSSLPPYGLQSTHPLMPCYISPYIVYNVYGPSFTG